MVTGAASGIGRATSILLAKKGCVVALADVGELGLAETKKMIEDAGGKATAHVVDVADRKRMERFPDEVLSAHRHVHVLVNNAGVAVTDNVETHDLDDFAWLFGVNFWGVVYGCRFFLPHMKKEAEAHIVNISSVFGFIGLPTQSAYCASKFAVRGFTEALHAELDGTNVGVTCVHPGGIATNIVRDGRMSAETAGMRDKLVGAFKKMMPPEKAGAQIVRAIETNDRRLLITREAYAIDAAKRIFPVLTNRVAIWGRKRAGI